MSNFNEWLLQLRKQFAESRPHLLPMFDTYAAEARFARRYIDADLEKLNRGAKILEIGAGSFLLSCQLVQEGFEVTALEPTGSGFSHFDQLRELILFNAHQGNFCPAILDLPAEKLSSPESFDYAFSINVMEHVDNVAQVLFAVGRSLSKGACYRFTCPNYWFPYEPHFNIPTVFSKRLTELILKRKIFNSDKVADPMGTWRSLNWISVAQIRNHIRAQAELSIKFNRSFLVTTLERMISDSDFAARRSPTVRAFISGLVRSRLHNILYFVPATLQPIIDCKVQRKSD